jgi:hypothetical protein
MEGLTMVEVVATMEAVMEEEDKMKETKMEEMMTEVVMEEEVKDPLPQVGSSCK